MDKYLAPSTELARMVDFFGQNPTQFAGDLNEVGFGRFFSSDLRALFSRLAKYCVRHN